MGNNNIDYEKLKNLALAAGEKAYAPYSGFRVGAAIQTKNGVYTGCNVENASFGAACCAERVAAFKAVSEGERDFLAIAVTENPCGICRQVLAEFNPDMKVYLIKTDEIFSLRELLPRGFELNK